MDGIKTYRATLAGVSPIIHHSGAAGLDEDSPIKDEIASITGVTVSKRTPEQRADLKMLESLNSLWLDANNRIEVPPAAIRAATEAAARKTKEGPAVREGLLVLSTQFVWDEGTYGTDGSDEDLRKLAKQVAFTVPVVVQRARIMRTRAKFDCPWRVVANIQVDTDLVEEKNLRRWLDVAGSRIGLGDWRPAKSGIYGRFGVESLEEAG